MPWWAYQGECSFSFDPVRNLRNCCVIVLSPNISFSELWHWFTQSLPPLSVLHAYSGLGSNQPFTTTRSMNCFNLKVIIHLSFSFIWRKVTLAKGWMLLHRKIWYWVRYVPPMTLAFVLYLYSLKLIIGFLCRNPGLSGKSGCRNVSQTLSML